MAPDKSLAAEIEAVKAILLKHVKPWEIEGAPRVTGIPEAAAEIAALQSRACEDGARWLRERAAETAKHRYSPLELERFNVNGQQIRNQHGCDVFMTQKEADRHVSERVAAIQALSLQPEGERNA